MTEGMIPAGIWLSRYSYYSSSRGRSFDGEHQVRLTREHNRLRVNSLSCPDGSLLEMDLRVDGKIVTGIWAETTAPDGYYRGARYHGAVQFVADLAVVRMDGKWVGFGGDDEINTGPWSLTFFQLKST